MMTYWDCVVACASNAEYIANWERLRGVRLPANPIEKMVDDATGYSDDIARMFLNDVFDVVYSRLPQEQP